MPKRPIRPDDLLRLVLVGDPQIHPSGDRVLFSRKTITEKNKYLSHLFTVDLEGHLHQWTQGSDSCSHGRWSPDGARISFVSGRDAHMPQIFLLDTQGGEACKLTALSEGSLGEAIWSPDSSKIAFTFRPCLPDATQAAVKERTEKGLSSAPMVFDDIKYRLDGDGYFGNQRYELIVIDVKKALAAGGDLGRAEICSYNGDVHGDYEFCWSPDSMELAITHSANKHPFLDPPNDQIFRLNCSSGEVRQIAGLPKGRKAAPRWSPDGHWLAYAGEVDENDPWGVRNTKVYLASVEGGAPKDLTGHQDFDCQVATLSDTRDATFGVSMQWALDGSGLFVEIGTRGETQLGFVSVEGGVSLLTHGHHAILVGSLSSNGKRIAATFITSVTLGQVAVLEPELVTGEWVPKILTDFNREFLEEVEILEPTELLIPTTDGLQLHGWVLKPKNVGETAQRPAVLQVHGGPHAQYGWTFFHELQCQAACGLIVVYTNPRGSSGYGEAWTSAIRGDWGNKDWEDIEAVTQWMLDQPDIDSSRIAIMGGSYGGFMTNWAIGHSDKYRCAITDRCVSNLISMAGNSDFPFNRDGYFGGVAYGDLEDIKPLWRQSPLAYFKNVKTPTLIIHSAGDLRCNIEQGEQVFSALQLEKIESKMVRYPETTSHGMSRSGPPDLRIHRLNEILNWLGKYLFASVEAV